TAAIDAHRLDPKVHRVLAEQVPRTGRLENIEAVERCARGYFRDYLEAHRSEVGLCCDIWERRVLGERRPPGARHSPTGSPPSPFTSAITSSFALSTRSASRPPMTT